MTFARARRTRAGQCGETTCELSFGLWHLLARAVLSPFGGRAASKLSYINLNRLSSFCVCLPLSCVTELQSLHKGCGDQWERASQANSRGCVGFPSGLRVVEGGRFWQWALDFVRAGHIRAGQCGEEGLGALLWIGICVLVLALCPSLRELLRQSFHTSTWVVRLALVSASCPCAFRAGLTYRSLQENG